MSLPGRRALTLIELLAAIAVLVVLSGIAMPVIAGRVAGARFEAAARQVESIVVLSRAESQRRGEALLLIVKRSGRVQQFVLEAWSADEGGASPGTDPKAAGTLLGELDESISINGKPPESAESMSGIQGDQSEVVEVVAAANAVGPTEEQLVIATFLPDGTAAVGGPIYLSDRSRTVVVKLNAWTGAAKVETYVPPTERGRDQGDGTKAGPDVMEDPKEM